MSVIKSIKIQNEKVNINDARISDNDITNWNDNSFYFVQGTSSQAGSSTSGSVRSTKWEGTITGITTPTNGLKIAYRIGGNKGVSTGGAVLSIDGGTTYYPVVYNVNTVISTRYDVGSMLLLTFNSTQTATAYMESGVSSEITGCWQAMDYDSTSTYQIKGQYGTMTTSGATYRYRILFTSADGTQWVPSNTSTSTNATASRTVNQTPIDPFGRIVYYNYTTAKSANTTMTASYLYTQSLVTLGYSFNRTGAALELTTYAPVYIKCAPQSDGSAIIDADNPYVQALPTTADGKIYIFLGIAYSATQVEMYDNHPIYQYVDGKIVQWTNAPANVDVSGKADKVSNATNGNFAALDSNGNLTDSGKKASDFQTALSTQTAYTSKGSATKVPQITTNTLGQVTGITEVTITQPSAPGTLNTTATTAQSTSSSEALSGSVTLHKVAKTGTYSDLIGKPTIPTVNNSTITLQANGATVDSFTTNASSAKTISLGNYLTSTTAGLKIEVVSALPASPDSNTIYIVQ